MDRTVADRDDVRRVLIAGDTHGNSKWVAYLTEVAADAGCRIIIQVGDFGYFPDHSDGPRFLTAVDTACEINGIELWFIDGNHDDHTSLSELEHGHQPTRIAEHVTFIPRGTRLNIGGRMFGFLGGAFSIDWRDRTPGIDWWQHEVTDTDDVARLGDDALDVLVTHDSPAGINLLSSWRLPAEDQVRADEVRALISEATTATSPRLVVHGHWHHGYESELTWIDRVTTERTGELTWDSSRVVGLGCDGNTSHGWISLTCQISTCTGRQAASSGHRRVRRSARLDPLTERSNSRSGSIALRDRLRPPHGVALLDNTKPIGERRTGGRRERSASASRRAEEHARSAVEWTPTSQRSTVSTFSTMRRAEQSQIALPIRSCTRRSTRPGCTATCSPQCQCASTCSVPFGTIQSSPRP